MDEERVSLLTNEQDVHLLREIAKWRRANGVSFFQWRPGKGFGAFTEWYRYAGRKRRTVSYEPGNATVLVTRHYYSGERLERLPGTNVTEVVDMLVALGFLPPRFSSAYRLGWDKANAFTHARATRMWIPPSEFAACEPAAEPVF